MYNQFNPDSINSTPRYFDGLIMLRQILEEEYGYMSIFIKNADDSNQFILSG